MEVVAVGRDVDIEGATVVLGMMSERVPVPGSEPIAGRLSEVALDAAGFSGKSGQTAQIPLEGGAASVVVGLGDEISFESIRSASASAARAANTERVVSFLGLVPIEDASRAVAEGSLLGTYRFDRYKTGDDGGEQHIGILQIAGGETDEIDRSLIIANATNLARDWVWTPAGDQAPDSFASTVKDEAPSSVAVEIWDRSRIEGENLGGLLGVAAGSERDPRVLVLEYRPEGAVSHLGLVGKGIIFDSGGLSIKPAKSMERMKTDMAGAAAVVAATFAIADLGLPINVTTVAPLTDNTIDGNATRPGDVLVPAEGPTIEVTNTDAEGRLILADGLAIARRHDPDLLIDVATLTGGVVVALGKQIAGLFSPDSRIAKRVLDAAERAGENMWELPLFKPYMKMLDSDIADLKNSTGVPQGSAIAAALFLSRFAGDGDWAHIDIAGPSENAETSGEMVKGPSGFGVRTLVELASDMATAS